MCRRCALETCKTKKKRDTGCLEPNQSHLEFLTRAEVAIFSRPVVRKTQTNAKIAQGNFYPTAIFSVLFVAQSRNYCLADIIGHAHTQTRPASLRRHPIITAPKRTTTAAMAAVTGLNAHGWPVLPWPGRGGCPGCSNSAAPAQHPALVRLGCFRTELPQTRAPNSARPTRHALHPTRQQAGSGWRAGRTVGRRQHLAAASF